MRELRPGLWHWTAPHPDWSPTEPWDQAVSSYALDDGERLLLFRSRRPARSRGSQPTGRRDVPWESVAAGLRPLLEKPVEHVLSTHGGPNDRAALEGALSDEPTPRG